MNSNEPFIAWSMWLSIINTGIFSKLGFLFRGDLFYSAAQCRLG